MGVKIGTCSLCRSVIETSLQNAGFLNYDMTAKNGKTVITVNIADSPKTWPKDSLRAMCWRQLSLDFHYHQQNRKGDMICCSNY
jgi:hypothetical protein